MGYPVQEPLVQKRPFLLSRMSDSTRVVPDNQLQVAAIHPESVPKLITLAESRAVHAFDALMFAEDVVLPWYDALALIVSGRPQLLISWVMFLVPSRRLVTVALTVRYVGVLEVLMYQFMVLAKTFGTPLWKESSHSPVARFKARSDSRSSEDSRERCRHRASAP